MDRVASLWIELGSILTTRRGRTRCGALRTRFRVQKSSQAPRGAASCCVVRQCDVLCTRLNATYLSPRTQNEIVEILGKHSILGEIVDQIKAAKFYSVLTDEVTSQFGPLRTVCGQQEGGGERSVSVFHSAGLDHLKADCRSNHCISQRQ